MKAITGDKYMISGKLFVACDSGFLKDNHIQIGETVLFEGKPHIVRGCMPPTPTVDKWAIWIEEEQFSFSMMEYPFFHEGMTVEEWRIEREYMADHMDDVKKGTYQPLWKQRLVDEIRNGIKSQLPIVVMNAIITGAENRIRDEQFIDGLRRQTENDTLLLNLRIGDFAIAALDVLGVEEYSGSNKTILELIKGQFNG